MTRLLSPDDACISVKVPDGRRTYQYDGRTLDVTSPSHIRVLKDAGYTVAGTAPGPVRSSGYECGVCGFKGFFNTCGRCGAHCERAE